MNQNITLLSKLLMVVALLFLAGCSHKNRSYSGVAATKYTSAARQRSTLRPYVVKHKRYTPEYVKSGVKQYGISSWYGPNFHGKHTSNGEVYNMHASTAAHKTFPMDTIVRVHNLENDKSTIVRINDRGPFVSGRIIDCSYKAGKEIGLDKSGIARVEITVLGVAGNKKQKKYIEQKALALDKSETLGVQLGVYSQLNGATACYRRYRNRYAGRRPVVKRVRGESGAELYKVWLVGFQNQEELNVFRAEHREITKG